MMHGARRLKSWDIAALAMFGILSLLASDRLAHAQADTEIVKATAGDWLLAPEDGRTGCRVQLRSNEVIGGYELRPSPSCLGVRTMMVTVVAWRFDPSTGGLVFTGPQRETLLAFTEKEDGTYASADPAGDGLLLLKAPPGVTAVPNAQAIFGTWSVLEEGGGDICHLTFSDQPPPSGEESYALALAQGCDAKLANLNLVSWRIEGLNLMLYGSDGESFTFQPAAKGTFVADDAKPPLVLVRR